MKERIIVDNLKCSGCATTIKNELEKIDGISEIEIFTETSEISINYKDGAKLNEVYVKLNSIGYPLTGTDQGGLEKLATNLKSYISCARGRLSKKNKSDKSQV